MYLSNIKLWNFRKFGALGKSGEKLDLKKPNLNLSFNSQLNVLIGENDSGKSAIIDAIKLVVKTHSYEWINIVEDDFYQEEGQSATEFRIELTFDGMSPDEAKNFTEWLGWNDGKTPFLRLIYHVKRTEDRIIPADIKAGVDDSGMQLTQEAKEYLKCTYLKPLRDAQNELIAKKNSRLSLIFQNHEAFKGKSSSHLLVSLFKAFNQAIEQYFEGLDGAGNKIDDDLGKNLKDRIDSLVASLYHAKAKSHLAISAEADLKSLLERLELSLKKNVSPGLGTLNRLFMAAELLHLSKENWHGLKLGLIEEIEAHLHPQAQMKVIESLQNESLRADRVQLILTTHSPNLASKVKLENLIICSSAKAFSLRKEETKLKETDYPFLERFLDVTKANLFFAKGILFVEGAAEELVIPALSKKLVKLQITESDITNSGVSIIAINNTAFSRYANIFKRKNPPFAELPVAIINDLDLRPTEYAVKYGIADKNKKKERIISEYNSADFIEKKKKKIESQSVKVFISKHWTFEYCLALHPTLRKILFKSILHAIEENRADSYSGKKPNKFGIGKIDEKQIDDKWNAFIYGKSKEVVAFNLMYNFIEDKKKLSKAVIAQYFAKFLEEDQTITKDDLLIADNPIEYIINGIFYACGN